MQNDQRTQAQAKILKEYKKQGGEIMRQMLNVLMRTQKKIDSEAYRKMLEKIEQETN